MDSQEKTINFSEEIVKCRSCNKDLFSILLLDSNLPEIKQGKNKIQISTQKMKSNCPFCKDESWTKIVTQKVMMAPIDGFYFKDIEQEVIGDTISMMINLEMIKK